MNGARTCLSIALFAVAIAFATPSSAAGPPVDGDKIAKHLEFLGYEVKETDKYLLGTHASKPNTRFVAFNQGTLLTTFFNSTDYARANRSDFLEFVNSFNKQASFASFFVDSDGDLGISAWFAFPYARGAFGKMIDRWNNDINAAIRNDLEKSKKFVK